MTERPAPACCQDFGFASGFWCAALQVRARGRLALTSGHTPIFLVPVRKWDPRILGLRLCGAGRYLQKREAHAFALPQPSWRGV